jgi:hypothetical protein
VALILTRIEELKALTDTTPTLIGWAYFPAAPAGPIVVQGEMYMCAMARWETDAEADPQNKTPQQAILALAVMKPDLFAAAQRTASIANAGQALRQGPNGPILDLNKLRN